MPRFVIPNSATIHSIRNFLDKSDVFVDDGGDAVIQLDPTWAHFEPVALSMVAAWGAHWRGKGRQVRVENLGAKANYAARMGLFDHLGVEFSSGHTAHEEAGRFLPLQQIERPAQIGGVIGDISAMLHLEGDSESLAAVQYCVSELLRNVLEHSTSPEGAFVCANRYNNPNKRSPCRVTIAVADCGQGVASHLSHSYPEALKDDEVALGLAMRPGITGAIPGLYGSLSNAGAGLFFTRCIAKGTGGYFFISSGQAAYRLKRAPNDEEMLLLYEDPFDEERSQHWKPLLRWQGTVVSIEVCTDRIGDYQGLFQWIGERIPKRESKKSKVRFT
ncbi:MAG: hypothetical protein KY445_11430 [Armatimonadetes bacterium]|nr:hypothetical protein [Armatimonadota bacterium]